MRYDVLHDWTTLEYQYLGVCFMWRWPDRELQMYMYISMKFGTGVHVFCWEVGVFNRSSFQSVSYKDQGKWIHVDKHQFLTYDINRDDTEVKTLRMSPI